MMSKGQTNESADNLSPFSPGEGPGVRVTAIFDIGKTNKKFFLFDADYREVHREYVSFPQIEDEDGYPTEDLAALQTWLREVFNRILAGGEYRVTAINFSSYGASFVHLDEDGRVVTPLYNYTKPIPAEVEAEFYDKYGPEATFAARTGSSRSGLLNSGLQLYWLKHHRPAVFARIRYSLHLPQYLSYVFTGIPISEYTSIGCHTALWDYEKKDYHPWVYAEKLHTLLPPIVSTETSINMNYNGQRIKIGVGVHDSSAALLPYIRGEQHPFVLVSTGTWSVSLNPFTNTPLGERDLEKQCINYMRIDGKPVKAARLFLGHDYQVATTALAERFGVGEDRHREVTFDYPTYRAVLAGEDDGRYETAYHELLVRLVDRQVASIRAAAGSTPIRTLFVDGGFSDNDVYIKLLAHHFRDLELRTTDSSLGSALGAAIAISDGTLNSHFLEENYALKKHQPFIINPTQHVPGL